MFLPGCGVLQTVDPDIAAACPQRNIDHVVTYDAVFKRVQPVLAQRAPQLLKRIIVAEQVQHITGGQQAVQRGVNKSDATVAGRRHWMIQPLQRAKLEFLLAQVLWDLDQDRGRARALAETALATFTRAGAAPDMKKVGAWLRAR